jgi:hypothetical protein
VSDRDIESYLRALVSDPDLGAVRMELADFRDAEFSVSPEAIARIAGLVRGELSSLPRFKRAVVVSSNVQYGLARMYALYVGLSGYEVVPFRDEAEARQWLGLPRVGEDT